MKQLYNMNIVGPSDFCLTFWNVFFPSLRVNHHVIYLLKKGL